MLGNGSLWIRTRTGSLLNLDTVASIHVYQEKPNVWWVRLDAGSGAWWLQGIWPGPFATPDEAEIVLRRIEGHLRSRSASVIDFDGHPAEVSEG